MSPGSPKADLAAVVALAVLALPAAAPGLTVDRRGDIHLGGRAYTAVRIGTQSMREPSFPKSAAGHLRQHRSFLEIEWNHDLMRLYREGKGLPALLRILAFELDTLRYNITYRGEHEGIYDYGPEEFSRGAGLLAEVEAQHVESIYGAEQAALFRKRLAATRRRLRRVGTQRHRLFQFFLELEKDPVFVRIGRQNLVWGETDNFRLLDNINPLDDGFGGLLIDLDERRVPLDMIRANVRLGRYGPFSDAFLEAFVALDDAIADKPGVPASSPWQFPGLGRTTFGQVTERGGPARTLADARGGARIVFNVGDATFTVAHYYTYLDTPAVRLRVPDGIPQEVEPVSGALPVVAEHSAPRIQISGGSFSFAVPSLYAVARGEFAFFRSEPIHRQSTLDPFCAQHPDPAVRAACPDQLDGFPFSHEATKTRNFRRDSLNFNLGWDMNRYIRFLNSHQTFFFTTQVFVKHIIDAPDDLVQPIPTKHVMPPNLAALGLDAEPRFARRQQTSTLQTLQISTSYQAGQVEPRFTFFYDWVGAILVQPGVILRRDPLRLVMDYTLIVGKLREVGFFRDRDNVRFQLEYVF